MAVTNVTSGGSQVRQAPARTGGGGYARLAAKLATRDTGRGRGGMSVANKIKSTQFGPAPGMGGYGDAYQGSYYNIGGR